MILSDYIRRLKVSSEYNLIIQKNKLLYANIIFNLPQSPIHRPIVTLWGGQAGKLHQLSRVVETLSGFGWTINYLIDEKLSHYLPVGVEKISYNLKDYASRAIRDGEIAQLLGRSSLVVAGPDMAINSSEQIMAEQIIRRFGDKTIITDELLRIFKITPRLYEQNGPIIFGDTVGLVKLANNLNIAVHIKKEAGVFNKLALLGKLGGGMKQFIVYDNHQVIVYDSTCPKTAGVYNCPVDLAPYRSIFLGLCAALLAAAKNTTDQLIGNVLSACYLLDRIIQDNNPTMIRANEIKKLINELL